MTSSFLVTIMQLDEALFTMINGQWTHPWANVILPWMRDSNHWFPFYGGTAWKWVVAAIVNVTLTDQISSSLFKPFFHRLRPCADPLMIHKVKLLLDHCSSGFSFTSSHAANHVGIAMFMAITLKPYLKNYRYLFFLWAGIIAYAQIYVGVHYPLDIIVGAFIGVIVGWVCAKFYLKYT
jgi:undecaprenyl-diphosphatase